MILILKYLLHSFSLNYSDHFYLFFMQYIPLSQTIKIRCTYQFI